MDEAKAAGAGATLHPSDSIVAALLRLGEGPPDVDVTIEELVASLDSRAFAFVVLLMALPNLTPVPSMPGFSTIFGIPVCIVAAQMTLGRTRLWLPHWIGKRAISRGRVARVIGHAIPIIRRIEKVLRPRWPLLTANIIGRWTGIGCLTAGILLSLPIPIFSMAPAFALVLLALGLLARDGAILVVGHAGVISSLIGFAIVVWAALEILGLR
jgi:hypothetical protein